MVKKKPEPDETMRCKTCRFACFVRDKFECRRYPPVSIWDGTTVDYRFPETDVLLWCGE
jgi:hypothetical protein